MTFKVQRGLMVCGLLLIGSVFAHAQLRPEVTPPPKQPHATSKPAQIVIQTSPEAQVYLDDVFKGQASEQGHLVIESPKAGNHTLRITLAGKKDVEQLVTLKPGQTANIRAAMQDVPGGGEKAKKESPKIETPHATTGALLITADAPCNLSVDGQVAGDLALGVPKRVSVTLGDHLLHAVSKEEPSASVDWTGKLATAEQRLVQLSLTYKIAEVRTNRKAAEAERAEQARLHSFTDIMGTWTGTAYDNLDTKCQYAYTLTFEVRPETQHGETVKGVGKYDLASVSPDTKNCRRYAPGFNFGPGTVWHDNLNGYYRASNIVNPRDYNENENPGQGFSTDLIQLTSPTSLIYTFHYSGTTVTFTKAGP